MRSSMMVLFAVSVLGAPTAYAESTIPAFPGAEGYGARATGGRGGQVISVTTLNDAGPGSLREAVEAKGPRIVVFKVAGTILLKSRLTVRHDDITIAGQTAPGEGICIRGPISLSADNVIIRYIRVRMDPSVSRDSDAIFGRYQKNIILDHISASWSTDEVFSVYMNENVTVQWCMITEACPKNEGDSHRFGGIFGNNFCTAHHNLLAHNDSRNPRWASGAGYNDFRNNVIYNWGYMSCYGGEASLHNSKVDHSTINMVANYFKAGPATKENVRDLIADPSARGSDDKGSWYVAGNYVDGYPDITANNWKSVDGDDFIKLEEPWEAVPINQELPHDAFEAVLADAGCSLPARDGVDRRIVEEVRSGTANHGANGIINHPNDVGGWPELESETAPDDADHDGMPDEWERLHGLNANSSDDQSADEDEDGYTNIEEYLNGTNPTEFVDYTKSLPRTPAVLRVE